MTSIKKYFYIWILSIVLAPPAFAAMVPRTLTVGTVAGLTGVTLDIPIMVDDPSLIAGAAFTIRYSNALSITVESRFFDSFYNQYDSLDTTGEPVEIEGVQKFPLFDANNIQVTDENGDPVYLDSMVMIGDDAYDQPLVTNTVNDNETLLMISAARCTPASLSDEKTLLTLHVRLKEGEPAGRYPIEIQPTTLNNIDAGYSPDGEQINLLIGSDLNVSIDSGDAFPVLLGVTDVQETSGLLVHGAAEYSDSADVPVVASFEAGTSSICGGSDTNLSWSVSGATSVTIDNAVGNVGATGSIAVNPLTSTTYTLTAVNAFGSATAQVLLNVSSNSPVIDVFAASEMEICKGDTIYLSWSINNADSASIDNVGSVSPDNGSKEVSPESTTNYILTATNGCDAVTRSITVVVREEPVIDSFSATPGVITEKGGGASLSWSVTGATSVSIDKGIGNVAEAAGTRAVTPNEQTTYTITATNACGSVSREVIVGVQCVPIIHSFNATPGQNGSTLNWDVANAAAVTIDQGIGQVDPSGSRTVSPETATTYTLTATNDCGSVTGTVTLAPAAPMPPVVPELLSPEDMATDVSLMPELTTGSFSDPNGDTHIQTRWQIADGPVFDEEHLVYDEISGTHLTNIIVPNLVLETGTLYYWRAFFSDGEIWSDPPATVYSFTTTPTGPVYNNGIDIVDQIGDEDPKLLGGIFVDGNGNPVNTDSIKSFKSKIKPELQIGLKVNSGRITKCGSIDPADIYDQVDYMPDLPFGLINFALETPTEEAVLTIYFSEPLPENFTWWKYDPNKKQVFDYQASIDEKVVDISGDRKTLTIKLKDGGYGDLISRPDSRIIDPSGPGFSENADVDGNGNADGSPCFIDTVFHRFSGE